MLAKGIILALALGVCFGALSPIIRPCEFDDYECMRENMAANSKCNPKVRGTVPSEYVIDELKLEAQYFNSTYIEKNLIVRNHQSCFVTEFYFNLINNDLIVTIDCPDLDLEADRILLRHHSKREDSEFRFHMRGTYKLVRFTINIRNAAKMDLCSTNVFTDVTTLPIFHVQPLDKPTSNYLSRDLTLLNIYERETFFYRGPHIMFGFIDNILCDFGCWKHRA